MQTWSTGIAIGVVLGFELALLVYVEFIELEMLLSDGFCEHTVSKRLSSPELQQHLPLCSRSMVFFASSASVSELP